MPDAQGREPCVLRYPVFCGQNPVLNRFTPAFLHLPEKQFLNIIFCSLPAVWGCELVLGFNGLCPEVATRAITIAPEFCPWFFPRPKLSELSC
jgi:hypothetical protein